MLYEAEGEVGVSMVIEIWTTEESWKFNLCDTCNKGIRAIVKSTIRGEGVTVKIIPLMCPIKSGFSNSQRIFWILIRYGKGCTVSNKWKYNKYQGGYVTQGVISTGKMCGNRKGFPITMDKSCKET